MFLLPLSRSLSHILLSSFCFLMVIATGNQCLSGDINIRLNVESCHIDGTWNKPKTTINIYNGTRLIYNSKDKHPNAREDDANGIIIQDTIDTAFDFDQGLKIVLKNGVFFGKKVHFEANTKESIIKLLGGGKKEKSWYKASFSYLPSEFTVKLAETNIALDDIGPIIKKMGNIKIPGTDLGSDMIVTDKFYGHQVVVWQNNTKIFDTGTQSGTCGLKKTWEDAKFKIKWNPEDTIEVGFYTFINKPIINKAWHTVFNKKEGASGSSFLLFNGTISGGEKKTSCVVFEIEK